MSEPPDQSRTVDELIAQGHARLRLDDYGFTGESYARVADGWVSVRGALPGELVEVAIEPPPRRTRRVFATLTKVVTPVLGRAEPGCTWDSSCRGCQLRHLSPPLERELKRRTIAEVVTKFSGLPQPPPVEWILEAPQQAARSRSGLACRVVDGSHYELGLVAPGHRFLVPMARCPASTPQLRALIARIEAWLDHCALGGQLPPGLTGIRAAASPLDSQGFCRAPRHGGLSLGLGALHLGLGPTLACGTRAMSLSGTPAPSGCATCSGRPCP